MMNGVARILDTARRNIARLKDSRVVWVLALVLIAVHLSTVIAGWSLADARPWELWGLSRDGVFAGRVWQIITHAVIHGSWFHLALNTLFLLVVGSRIEHITGGRVVWATVLAGVVSGAAMHVALGHGILVGMSGGAFALWMLLIGLSPDSRMLPFPGPCLWLGWGILTITFVLAACDPVSGFGPPRAWGQWLAMRCGSWIFEIGHACHLGGGIAGWLVGLWLLRPRVTLHTLQEQRARREREHRAD